MTSSNQSVSDEQLSAYLDGMLDGADARALEAALESDPGLGRRLAAMARNDRALRQHFREAARRPAPPAISAMLEPAPRKERSRWSALARRLTSWNVIPVPLQAIGAVAVLAGVGIAVLLMLNPGASFNGSTGEPALVRALPSTSPEVSRFLDRQASGEVLSLGDAGRAVVDMSFEHVDGRYCRQYRVALGDAPSSFAAIACRSGGDWQEMLMQRVDGPVGESGLFHAASGQASSVLDGYILENAAGDIMVGESEAELIERNWSKP
ncbi:anti-sigma factor family protein [Wenzhouxiangella sp. EGI_FJ10409]|uniref:anti-sigma factor family protein n=1 Tax=Wenzhouxiangella sp. EGI_FJ10409 TaxID=3243767 RepID=UPI0035DF45B1